MRFVPVEWTSQTNHIKALIMTIWHNICITDNAGKKIFKNNCSEMSLDGQIRELERHLEGIKNWHEQYAGIDIDVESAYIDVDGTRLQTMNEIFDELEKEFAL